MKVFHIYHIKGWKVGCTKDLPARKLQYKGQYGFIPRMEILRVIPQSKGEKYAGDVERRFADKFGYHRGVHYETVMKSIRASAKKGGDVGGFVTMSAKTRQRVTSLGGKACASQGKSGLKHLTFEDRSVNGRKLIAEGRAGFKMAKDVVCPHCKVKGHLAIMTAWHFDRCKDNPKLSNAAKQAKQVMSVNNEVGCPHCKQIGQKPAMHRWHFDNCKYRKNKDG